MNSGFFGHGNKFAADRWIPINMQQMDILWTIYRSDPVIQACRSFVSNKLFSLGVMYSDNKRKKMPIKDFFNHIQRTYVPFCREFVDCLYVQGFVMYTVSKTDKCPVIVPNSAGRICIRRRSADYRVEMAMFGGDNEKPLKNIYFFRDIDPGVDGMLQSPLSAYYRSRSFCDMIERNAAMVGNYLASPPIYTQTQTNHAFDDRDLAGVGEVDGMRASMQRDSQMVRNRITAQTHAQQEKLVETLNRHMIDTSNYTWQSRVDPVTGLPNFDAAAATDESEMQRPVVPLPNDASVAQVNFPQARTDLVAIQERTFQQACIIMGVPPNLIMGSGSVHSAGVAQTQGVVHSTFTKLKSCITQCLVDVYHLVFDPQYSTSVTVQLPGIHNVDVFKNLYFDGTVTFDAYKRFLTMHYELQNKDFVTDEHNPDTDQINNTNHQSEAARVGGESDLLQNNPSNKRRKRQFHSNNEDGVLF